jgi:MoaA/NifB/PqqE/SkfB family radical SAM enzyme
MARLHPPEPSVTTNSFLPQLDPQLLPERVSGMDDQRLIQLGVDLSRYLAVWQRQTFEPMETSQSREISTPILRGFKDQILGRVSDPVMLTHIVTTRCNYSCGFCSFADTLNAKTNELSLEEIEKTYATIGQNLNVIVYSGGETTLNRNLPEIIEAAYRLTPVKSVYIISNAWKPNLLLEITHQVMQRCPGLHLTWSLSIEGPKPINNATRYTQSSNWDAWQNTVDAMEGLKAIRERFNYRELDIQLCTVCSPGNVDVLDDWYERVRDVLQPDKWNLNLMRKSVQMSTHQLASFDDRRSNRQLEPFEQKYLEITQRVREDVLSGSLKFLYHTSNPEDGALKSAVDLISQEENRRTVLEEKPQFCCKAGNMGAYIGSDGTVSCCEEFAHHPAMPKSFGNLREASYDFQALWRSEQADGYRELAGQAPECRGCTLESQRNYPSILISFKTLIKAKLLAGKIHSSASHASN